MTDRLICWWAGHNLVHERIWKWNHNRLNIFGERGVAVIKKRKVWRCTRCNQIFRSRLKAGYHSVPL